MKRVITYGTFDLLHYGHINLLRRAKQYGDYLIVALSTDEFNWNEKQKKCYFSYEKRKQLLEAIRYVDLVIPEESWEQKRSDIREYHVDTFVMGDDWQGKFDFLQDLCQVVYLPRTPEISTRCRHWYKMPCAGRDVCGEARSHPGHHQRLPSKIRAGQRGPAASHGLHRPLRRQPAGARLPLR